jgi:hypothetical protein
LIRENLKNNKFDDNLIEEKVFKYLKNELKINIDNN